jgi:hypothetical protein
MRYAQAVVKALRLIRDGKIGLLVAIPLYRSWWFLRRLDFGVVSLQKLGLRPDHSNYHKDGGGPFLRDLLRQLNITGDDAVIDIGSGKGGAMATMARFPFKIVDGVEISSELVEVARRNLSKLQLQQCRVFLADALAFTELDDYTYIFMYNPFPEAVLEKVLGNIEVSLKRKPRVARLIYSNPLHEDTILASGTFTKSMVYEPYQEYRISVYETDGRGILGKPSLSHQMALQ